MLDASPMGHRPVHRRRDGGPSFLAHFLVAAALLFVLTLMWGIASPVPSAPDENAQTVKAAGTARGTLIGTPLAGLPAYAAVKVPETIVASQKQSSCSYGNVDAPACAVSYPASARLVSAPTYVARYPPLYYFLTGLPTLVSGGHWTLHAMRAVSALIVALLLGLAFACVTAYGDSGLLTLAAGAVVTPTVLYIGAVVNPSAMEIAGAIAMWSALTVLVLRRSADPPLPAVVSATIGAVALCASRPLSTLWYALIVAAVVLLRPGAARALSRLRAVRVAGAVSLAVALASGIFVLAARSYELEPFPISKRSTTGYLLADVGHAERVLQQVIGAFGAPDFSLPVPLLAVWLVTGFGVIGLAVMAGARRDAMVIAGLTAVFGFVLPFAIIYSHIRTDGVVWQGRYSLPIIAGLPLLAAAVLTDRYGLRLRAVGRRLTGVVAAGLAFGQIGAFYWYLRRYTVGLAPDSTNAFRHPSGAWSPPIPAVVVFVVVVVATVVAVGWLARQTLRASDFAVGDEGATPV